MESHPQNPEFRNNPENFHPCLPYIIILPFTILSKEARKFRKDLRSVLLIFSTDLGRFVGHTVRLKVPYTFHLDFVILTFYTSHSLCV